MKLTKPIIYRKNIKISDKLKRHIEKKVEDSIDLLLDHGLVFKQVNGKIRISGILEEVLRQIELEYR
jgi:ribosome-associated translation inhibitor RaiA